MRDDATTTELEGERKKILHEMDAIDNLMDSLKSQLASARRHHSTGEWHDKAESTLRQKARRRQSLQASLGEVNSQLKRRREYVHHTDLIQCLKEIGEARLGKEKWHLIWVDALQLQTARMADRES